VATSYANQEGRASAAAEEEEELVIVVDLRDTPIVGSTFFAVRSAAGLENRQGPKVYTVNSDDDMFWLRELLPNTPQQQIDVISFLDNVYNKYGSILYDSNQSESILPSVVTIAGVFDLVPMDETLWQKFPNTQIKFDTRNMWKRAEDAVNYTADNMLNSTSTLALQPTSRLIRGHLADWITKEKIFTQYLENSCLPLTEDKSILRQIVENSPWRRPVRVYGYNSLDPIFGGDLFEAETDCVNVMGQVATGDTNNLAFWTHVDKFPDTGEGSTLIQNPTFPIKYQPDKSYVALVYGDMDNIDFVYGFGHQHMQIRSERCSKTTCFPLTWTISPNLVSVAPAIIKWYYRLASKTGRDYFIMPPSGTLYAYPSMMPAETQIEYMQQQNQHAVILNTTGTIHWEWFFSWGNAWKNFFPRFVTQENPPPHATRAFFLNNVPWPFPILDMVLRGQTYRWLGDPLSPGSIVGFKPAFNWQENGPSGGNPGNSTTIAKMVNKLKVGSIQYVYIIQSTPIESVFSMVDQLEPHVQLVDYQQLVDLARQRHSLMLE